MAGELDLRRLAEDLGTALQDWARSSSSGSVVKDRGVVVCPDDTLVFDQNDESMDYPLTTLRSSLRKAADLAHSIASTAGIVEGARSRDATKRKAITIKDSLSQIIKLLDGEKLDDPEQREFEREPAMPVVKDDIEQFEIKLDLPTPAELREAQIYRMIKIVQSECFQYGSLGWQRLQTILDFINPNQPTTQETD